MPNYTISLYRILIETIYEIVESIYIIIKGVEDSDISIYIKVIISDY